MVRGVPPVGPGEGVRPRTPTTPGFGEILKDRLRLSAHAQSRLGGGLGPEEARRLESAVADAERKGAKQSLVLLGDLALIVSIRNRTVITALGPERQQSNTVVTGIDSAVIIR